MKIWFLTCPMPVLSGRTNFNPFLKTWKFFTPKFPMKYSKNGQNFTTPKNTWNVIFETCWTPCKKPHFSMWPKSRNTFFWLTPYDIHTWVHIIEKKDFFAYNIIINILTENATIKLQKNGFKQPFCSMSVSKIIIQACIPGPKFPLQQGN